MTEDEQAEAFIECPVCGAQLGERCRRPGREWIETGVRHVDLTVPMVERRPHPLRLEILRSVSAVDRLAWIETPPAPDSIGEAELRQLLDELPHLADLDLD